MFRGQKDSRFYWKHFGIWAFGIMISFLAMIPTAIILAAMGMTLEEGFPVLIAVLTFPMVAFGAYGINKRRFISYFPNHVYVGKTAVAWGIATIIFYVVIVSSFIRWPVFGLGS